MSDIQTAQAEIIEEFALFDDWMERYELLISMGKHLAFPDEKKTDQYLIRGCQSQVWIDAEVKAGKLYFTGVSDSAIVSGLMSVLFAVYSNQTAADILKTPATFIEQIGFEKHLSPTRKNGLFEMLKRIKLHAQQALV